MLDANETDPGYFDVRGTMLIDPAISSDVALVERMIFIISPILGPTKDELADNP